MRGEDQRSFVGLTGGGLFMSKITLDMEAGQAGAGGEGLETSDLNLAACLVSMGFEMEAGAVKIVRPDRPSENVNFTFKSRSRCGKFSVADMVTKWRAGAAFIEKEPEHKLAYTMAALSNRAKLLDLVKGMRRHHVLRDGKQVVVISDAASLETQRKLLGGGN